jgi:menaquinone-dependent protoporphyrinogen oxidase
MRIAVVYGSTEGHTRDLSEFAARSLREDGHQVARRDAARDTTDLVPGKYNAVLLAASLHVGHYQPALVQFARLQHHAALNTTASAFIWAFRNGERTCQT